MKKWAYIASVLMILIGVAPILSMLAATAIADFQGCTLNEANVYPCMIFGADWGSALNVMFVLAWFAMLTILLSAFGVLGLLALLGLEVYDRLRR